MIRVVFATPDAELRPPDLPDVVFTAVRPAAIRAAVASLRPHVVWIDADSAAGDVRLDPLGPTDAAVLLTRAAVVLAADCGWVPEKPSERVDRAWRAEEEGWRIRTDVADSPPIRGHACFRRHRLFGGLGGGVHTWKPREGEPFRAWTWRRPRWPAHARVIAVERAGMGINPDRATLWEYPGTATAPHTVCIGAYLPIESEDSLLRPRIHRLLHNSLHYLAGRIPGGPPDLHWEVPDSRVLEDGALEIPDLATPGTDRPRVDSGPLPLGPGPLRRAGVGDEDPFTVAGPRALITGREGSGAREIWMHPIRVATAIRLPGTRCAGVMVTPLGIERTLRVEDVEIVERISVPGDSPAAVLEYERTVLPGPEGILGFRLEWISDLRLAAPYPAGSTGPLHWRAVGETLVIQSGRTGESVVFHANVVPATGPAGVGGNAQAAERPDPVRFTAGNGVGGAGSAGAGVECSLTCGLRPGDRLRVLVAARVHESDDAGATLRGMRAATSLVRARAASFRRLQHERLGVATGDERIGLAIEWEKARLDRCLVQVPGLGRSLVGGCSTCFADRNDGPPVCAWRFGPESAWTAHAALACGSFSAVRDTLAFLGRHQDVSGRILHECTTSGAVQYDTADSTPVYLRLVARYMAWTGDGGFIRSQWEQVRKAVEFCLLTDRDGDLWSRTLRELGMTAESIGDARFAAELGSRAKTVRLAGTDAGTRAIPGSRPGFDPAQEPGSGDGADPVGSPALAILPFVHGLLGVEPDAVKGRLRLRPRIPDDWNHLEVRNLRMGEASLRLRYRKERTTHVFTLDQEEGAVPIRVILEPALRSPPTHVRVDDQPALLEARPFGDRVLVPVQLVLDHVRVVELDVEPPA